MTRIGKTLLATLALTLGPAAAHAQVSCGDVIGPNETVVLSGDLLDCAGPEPALTIVGPATLDLNAFRIDCDLGAETVGLLIVGERAVVRGNVRGTSDNLNRCDRAVVVAGEGRHRLTEINPHESVIGIDIQSDRNVVEDSVVESASAYGVLVGGDGNRLRNVESNGAAAAALQVSGSRNRVTNSALNASDVGARITGDRNVVRDSAANLNARHGFVIMGERNLVVKNRAGNNTEHGFWVSFSSPGRNRLSRNDAYANGAAGMIVWTEGNRLSRNSSLVNDKSEAGHADLEDRTEDCTTNRWRNNVYMTSNSLSGCIQ